MGNSVVTVNILGSMERRGNKNFFRFSVWD